MSSSESGRAARWGAVTAAAAAAMAETAGLVDGGDGVGLGYSARCARLLDLNRRAAAAAMDDFRSEQHDRAQRRREQSGTGLQGRIAWPQGAAAIIHRSLGSEQPVCDRLARMIAPTGGGATIGVSSPKGRRLQASGAPPTATPPPSAREIQERESRRHAFLRQGVATGGSVLKAPRPSTLGSDAYAAPTSGADLTAVRRRLSPISGDNGADSSSLSSSPSSSPRVKPMLTTADGRQVYIDEGDPMELPSSSDEDENEDMSDQDNGTNGLDTEAARGLVLDEPWEVLEVDADGSSSDVSSPGMFGEGERALYSLYMDSISGTDIFIPGSNEGEEASSGQLDWLQGQLNDLRESERQQEEEVAAALASVDALYSRQRDQRLGDGLPWSVVEPGCAQDEPNATQADRKSGAESVWRSLGRPPTQQLEFSRHLASVHLRSTDGSGSPQGRSTHDSGGISTIVLQADGSFSQRIQVGAEESAVGSSSAAWSQTKRGRFVAVPDNTETGVLSLEFFASGVETRGFRPGHGDSLLSPPGSPNTKLEASSGQLNQHWAARLEGASLLISPSLSATLLNMDHLLRCPLANPYVHLAVEVGSDDHRWYLDCEGREYELRVEVDN